MSAPAHALVTGGSSGIGKAIAVRLGRAGHRVTICGRSSDRLQETAEDLAKQDIYVTTVVADVSDLAQVRTLVAEAVATN
ncbi:SDR family NAD(P)-dependent oxidoreductase, partial [Dermacoccus abyssi]